MKKRKKTTVECLGCREHVPVSQAVRVIKAAGDPEAGYHLCDACRLDDLGPHDAENSIFVEQIEQESGPAGLHSLILQALRRLGQSEEAFTLGALRRDVQPFLDTVDAAAPLVQVMADSGKETSLKEILEELEADMGMEDMNRATKLLYQLLLENADWLDEGPGATGDSIHMILDGQDYDVICVRPVGEDDMEPPDPANDGSDLLFRLLGENIDSLDDEPTRGDGVVHVVVDGQEYEVRCEPLMRDGDFIKWEGDIEEVFPHSLITLMYSDGRREEREISAEVTLCGRRITVSHVQEGDDGEDVTVTYHGEDHGGGHFELRFNRQDVRGFAGMGWATLHRSTPQGRLLEGSWNEAWGDEQIRGAWTVLLRKQATPSSGSRGSKDGDQPCPFCGSDRVVPIVYGELPYEPEKRKTFVGGGCCVRDENWHCMSCDAEWP